MFDKSAIFQTTVAVAIALGGLDTGQACAQDRHRSVATASGNRVIRDKRTVRDKQSISEKQVTGNKPTARADEDAAAVALRNCIVRLVHGPACDASVRQTVWSTEKEVVGVGQYVTAGGGTGRYRMSLTMHDGVAKHAVMQICDGRLAWTRTDIGGRISLRRVDVSRLDSWVLSNPNSHPADSHRGHSLSVHPSHRVGGLVEMLDQLTTDHDLQLASAKLDDAPVVVVTATMTPDAIAAYCGRHGIGQISSLHPTQMRIAIATGDDPQTGFGAGLPQRLEFWSDPVESSSQTNEDDTATRNRRLISLIQLHSIRQIEPPPAAEFRYDNRDGNVEFINETDRYLERHGIRLTEAQQLQLRR